MPTRFINIFLCIALCAMPAHAAGSIYMEDMTWMEIRDRVQQGANVAIIPTGGVEQGGPQIVTGKHNIIVRYTAGEIAKRLGNALVAPVIPFSPAGRIDPPEGHMQFPGTISVREETFINLLEDAASSLKQAGFRTICIIGDHGGAQKGQQYVASRLSDMWESSGVRVIHVGDYYANNGQEAWMNSIGLRVPNPTAHAGLIDTSETMALDTRAVRDNMRGVRVEHDYQTTGARGDSTKASATSGKRFLSLKVEAAVDQIIRATSGVR